jgi:hypothetical protein
MERFFLLTMAGFLPAIANAATDKAEHDLPRPNILWLTFAFGKSVELYFWL